MIIHNLSNARNLYVRADCSDTPAEIFNSPEKTDRESLAKSSISHMC